MPDAPPHHASFPLGRAIALAGAWLAVIVAGGRYLPLPFVGTHAPAAWPAGNTPLLTIVGLLWLGVVLVGTYLLVMTAATVVAGRIGRRKLAAVAATCLPRRIRPFLVVAATAGAVVPTFAATTAGAATPPGPAPTMRLVTIPPPTMWRTAPKPPTAPSSRAAPPGGSRPSPTGPTTATPPATSPTSTSPTSTSPPPTLPASTTHRARPPARHRPAPVARPTARRYPTTPPAHRAPDGTHVVQPGESFWSIATAALAASGDPPPADRVADYWHLLMAANRDRLPVPGHPDLLFPGDRLTLPAPPPGA